MKKNYFLSTYLALFIITTAALFAVDAPAQTPANVSQSDLQEIVLNAGGGKIKVTLPADIRAGDTISGTVWAEPIGETKDEQYKNSAELRGTVVEIAGSKQTDWKNVGDVWTANIRFALTDGKSPTVLLKSNTGITISSAPLPIQPVGVTTPPVSAPTADNFRLPRIGQQGRPVTIPGPFDGNSGNTTVTIGGKQVPVIAESPRKAVIEIPAEPVGNAPINLREANVEKTGTIRSLDVKLTAPKTNLLKGEKTNVTITINGLEGLKEPIPLKLETTGSVNMQRGNTQNMTITPKQVGNKQIFTTTRTITGVKPGGFNVSATVLADPEEEEEQEQGDCKCECTAQPSAVVRGPKSSIKGGGTKYTYSPNFNSRCQGTDKCEKEVTYSWSIDAKSTATYKIKKAGGGLEVEVTGSGTLIITVTATVKCNPGGATCSASGTKTFDVTK